MGRKAAAVLFVGWALAGQAEAFAPAPGLSLPSQCRGGRDTAVCVRMDDGFDVSDARAGVAGGAAQREDAKTRLKQLVARTKQGKGASDSEREAIFKAMEAVEALNPTPAPAESTLLEGKWSLLYTGASVEDAAKRRAKEGVIGSAVTEITGASDTAAPRGLGQVLGEDDQAALPLGRRLTTLAAGAVENKGNFQDIDVARGLVENRAEFKVLGLAATVRIKGRCERVTGEAAVSAKRLAVFFERVDLKLGAVQTSLPLTWANDGKGPEGWVDTTFLDSDLRTGRGDKGSFFVAARRSE